MKIIIKLIKIYLNILSIITPKKAGDKAFKLFQKVRLKKIRAIEESYYLKAKKFNVPLLKKEALKCYEFGENNDCLVFLVHGWESNAGCMTMFANELVDLNYRVVGFDLPGHATNKESKTNLFEAKEAFKKLIKFINPKQSFSIISHSFGSVVTAFTINELKYKVDKIVFLSTNNKLIDVFNHFQKMIGFNDEVALQFKKIISRIMNEGVEEMAVAKKMTLNNFNQLLIIQDKYDKVIPFQNAVEISESVKNTKLIPFEKIGHYRMLWNKKVIEETIKFLEN